jgi:hypothetical protein
MSCPCSLSIRFLLSFLCYKETRRSCPCTGSVAERQWLIRMDALVQMDALFEWLRSFRATEIPDGSVLEGVRAAACYGATKTH